MNNINLLYYPRLRNGEKAPLPWPIKFFRWTNHICWPVEDNAPHWYYAFDRFIWIFGFLIFVLHNDAESRYLRENFKVLDDLLTGMPTYIILIEIHIRGFVFGLRKEKLKKLLKYFYTHIYIEESHNPKQFKIIQRQLFPTHILSVVYVIALSVLILGPTYLLFTGVREPLYKMIPPVEYKQHLYTFLPVMFSNIWVGVIVETMILGSATIMATLIFHLNGRYIIMRENFHKRVERILKNKSYTDIVAKYHCELVKTLKENIRLNKFAEDIRNEFSFEIFMIFGFSALTLCALGFKAYTSPLTSIGYFFWMVAKIQETLSYGDFGSTIIETTDQISSMYYESKWEEVIAHSSDTEENIRLMKLITLSILTNKKPFNLSGLNFFSVSLTSVLSILQGAGSYFTCLIALR